jgi:hypothetical protein
LLAAFGVAMGLMEAIIVVYLRELFYPKGFWFPLQSIPDKILLIEAFREACTIVMIVTVAAISTDCGPGRGMRRFARFLFIFGVWDAFYYVGLKLFLDWPPSLLTWDILFLIPIIWTGPVLAPLIVAATMIGLGALIAYLSDKAEKARSGPLFWSLLIFGAAVIVLTFLWDQGRLVIEGGFIGDLRGFGRNSPLQEAIAGHVPEHYPWWLFAVGETVVLAAAALLIRTNAPPKPQP